MVDRLVDIVGDIHPAIVVVELFAIGAYLLWKEQSRGDSHSAKRLGVAART
jgi:hypothetical protein